MSISWFLKISSTFIVFLLKVVVLYFYFNWFIVPLGLHQISFYHTAGLLIAFNITKFKQVVDILEYNKKEIDTVAPIFIGGQIGVCLVLLGIFGVGYVLKFFI